MTDPLAGFCGDYCGKCTSYSSECAGCVPDGHADCHFVNCCAEKQIQHCGLCGDFPCLYLIEFCPDDHPGCPPGYHIQNLKARARIGTGAWLEEQKRKWPAGKKPRV